MYNCAYIVILLSAVAVLGKIEDALLVPVSISYEKLLDGNFNRELMVGDFLAQPGQCCANAELHRVAVYTRCATIVLTLNFFTCCRASEKLTSRSGAPVAASGTC